MDFNQLEDFKLGTKDEQGNEITLDALFFEVLARSKSDDWKEQYEAVN